MSDREFSDGLPVFSDLSPQFIKIPPGLWIPDGLEDMQVGWHMTLLKASLRSELLGYLILCKQECGGCSACLWRVAGARHQDFFRKKSPVVIAAWEPGQIAGRRVMYFPPVIECLAEQLKAWRTSDKRKRRVQDVGLFHSDPQRDMQGSSSLYLGFKETKAEERKPQISGKLAERLERERRGGLTRARKLGLRNYNNHPLEDWEQPAVKAFAAAGD